MGRKYPFGPNQDEIYFITCTTVRWIDLFTRDVYRQIIIDSLAHCQREKGLDVYAWVIMTNHLHLIVGQHGEYPLGRIIGAFKAHTSTAIRKEIETNVSESRQDWLLWMFNRLGTRNPNNIDFQFWKQDGSHPVLLDTQENAGQRLHYLHYNPVVAGFVHQPEHWRWSSAIDYAGGKGLLDGLIFLE